MNSIAQQFVQFCISEDVLRFGQFELRSGRTSPYFFNFGALDNGASLSQLGQYYADKIIESSVDFDVLFGPAYKGIPIATTVACALHQRHGRSVKVCFNRKEAKTHGEQGLIIGEQPRGRVLLVDDVLTSGLAASEAIELVNGFPETEVAGLLIGLDRQEQSPLRDRLQLYSIARLSEVIDYIRSRPEMSEHLEKMQHYYQKYAQ